MAELKEVHCRSRSADLLEVELEDGTRHQRDMTPKERALQQHLNGLLTEDTHGIWYCFREEVLELEDYDARDEAAEEFAQIHPAWVQLAAVDNESFMSSDLVFVRHGTGDNYMGITAVLLPQGGPHAVFFLYPAHSLSVVRALGTLVPGLEVPSPGEERAVAQRSYARRPSEFDFFQDRWREKPWYRELGHLEALEALAARYGADGNELTR